MTNSQTTPVTLDYSGERSQRNLGRFLLAIPIVGNPPQALATAWHSALVERLGRDVDQVQNLDCCALTIADREVRVSVQGSEQALDDWTGRRALHTAIQDALNAAHFALAG